MPLVHDVLARFPHRQSRRASTSFLRAVHITLLHIYITPEDKSITQTPAQYSYDSEFVFQDQEKAVRHISRTRLGYRFDPKVHF